MEFQTVVAANVLGMSLFAAAGMARFWRQGYASWIVVNLATLVVTGLAMAFAPDMAGYVALAIYLPLFIIPYALRMICARRMMAGRWREAAKLARIVALLHPTPAMRFDAPYADAMAAVQHDGDIGPLTRLAGVAPPNLRPNLELSILVEQDRWTDALAMAATSGAPGAALIAIRALGETGRIDQAIEVYASVEGQMQAFARNLCRLWLFSFAGRQEPLELLLARPFSFLAADAKTYCRALARAAHGEAYAARATLTQLAAESEMARLRAMAARHLAGPSGPAHLSARANAILDEAAEGVFATYGRARSGFRDYPVTISLVAAISVMFALEMARGGSEDPQTLIDLGALWPPLVMLGKEYWRLLAPAFLHFGPVHFGGNALMLAGLGAVIERIFGSPRMALIYFVGAIGSATSVLLAMHFDYIDEGFFVGASGAIFALLGAEAAWVLWKWRARRLGRDLAGIFSILGVVVFQVGFDALVPVASTTGHLSGFASGFLTGALILKFWPLRPPGERRAQGQRDMDE